MYVFNLITSLLFDLMIAPTSVVGISSHKSDVLDSAPDSFEFTKDKLEGEAVGRVRALVKISIAPRTLV